MRLTRWLSLVLLLVAATASATEPKCPLDLTTCLNQYQRMKERPWLGVGVETDSLGRRQIKSVEPGSPAERAGIRPGDVLQTIEGLPPQQWFASKAGWNKGEKVEIGVERNGKDKKLPLPCEGIPEPVFARIIGAHMIEGHLAYMHEHREGEEHKH